MFRRHRDLLVAVLTVVVLAAGCSGGARPTLTGDRLVETPDSAADQDPAPTAVPAAPSTAAPDSSIDDAPSETASLAPGEVEQLVVQVLETFPHDPAAFTQGLELHNGLFVESTGSRGPNGIEVQSTLRRVDPTTGNVNQSIALDQTYFGEGLTRIGDELVQLTWQQNTAFYWNAETFELNREVGYDGEGWGLCYDGSRLIMTDGTPVLIFRDPVSFADVGRVPVTLNGQDVFNLNEVECVDGVVWANIWKTELIVRIDPATGAITGVVDASEITVSGNDQDAVLNGIAWDATTQSFYVTGKLWPTMYRVNFVPIPEG